MEILRTVIDYFATLGTRLVDAVEGVFTVIVIETATKGLVQLLVAGVCVIIAGILTPSLINEVQREQINKEEKKRDSFTDSGVTSILCKILILLASVGTFFGTFFAGLSKATAPTRHVYEKLVAPHIYHLTR